jgi:hypothetical protein
MGRENWPVCFAYYPDCVRCIDSMLIECVTGFKPLLNFLCEIIWHVLAQRELYTYGLRTYYVSLWQLLMSYVLLILVLLGYYAPPICVCLPNFRDRVGASSLSLRSRVETAFVCFTRKMEARRDFETPANIYPSTRRTIPKYINRESVSKNLLWGRESLLELIVV